MPVIKLKKIKSGIIGFNSLVGGGLNQNSITLVVGPPGVGKTTFSIQFVRRGLEQGNDALFVSLDENQEQIIQEAEEMGWDKIRDYIDENKLVFIDAGGKKFSEFVRSELPVFVEEWKGSQTRISIDPLTPVIWAVEDKYEQRELLMLLFKEVKKIGTIVCTLEEHGTKSELSGPETIIPMYLADTVIHLQYRYDSEDKTRKRELHVLKSRNSRHSHGFHQYTVVKGFGLVLKSGHEYNPDMSKIDPELRTELEKSLMKLPPMAADRVRKAIPQITQEDLKDVDFRKMITDLLDDYKNE